MAYAHIIIDPIDYTEVAENLRAHAANVMLSTDISYYNKFEFPQNKDTVGKSRGELLLGKFWRLNSCPINNFLQTEIIFGLYDCIFREQECLYALFLAEYLESDFPAYLESLQPANAS